MSAPRRATNPFSSMRLDTIKWRPLGEFMHPLLAERPPIDDRRRQVWAGTVSKSCAGLSQEWRADPERLRETLRNGRWDPRTTTTARWMAPGEPIWMLAWWYDECALSISEIARMRMHVSPEWDSWAPWLNVWAANPQEPKPWVGMWGYEWEYDAGKCTAEPERPPW